MVDGKGVFIPDNVGNNNGYRSYLESIFDTEQVDDGKGGYYAIYYDDDEEGFVIDHIYTDENGILEHTPTNGVFGSIDSAKMQAQNWADQYMNKSKKDVRKMRKTLTPEIRDGLDKILDNLWSKGFDEGMMFTSGVVDWEDIFKSELDTLAKFTEEGKVEEFIQKVNDARKAIDEAGDCLYEIDKTVMG